MRASVVGVQAGRVEESLVALQVVDPRLVDLPVVDLRLVVLRLVDPQVAEP